jgi:DMSO reductase iron-sulfur subunit
MLATTPQPTYSFLDKLKSVVERSQFGTPVDLDKAYPALVGEPLTVNGKQSRSSNPNRYKQHGFHFNADNCIACHACESACSEKNNLPPHLAFRKVGYIEGGSYPDVVRLNISMACNHCEDPVCLKACPTRAYTKYAEYGAVLQDPNICFGCGYCTWVCPYNAPQLDPVNGQVEKCNMCVDRLEQGLKPACVAACLGNALDFGVIEDLPGGREQVKLAIPGFPDPTISRPNIRFQQTRALPPDFTRPDGVPIHYQKDEQGQAQYQTKTRHASAPAGWGIAKLSSRENPLVAFTLLSQGVVGAFLALVALPTLPLPGAAELQRAASGLVGTGLLFGLLGLLGVALLLSATHLGKTRYFYRGFNNLRHSWLSREAAALAGFFGALGGYALLTAFAPLAALFPSGLATLAGTLAALLGVTAIYCMVRIYRIKARPFWNHWHTNVAFFASLLILGALGVGLTLGVAEYVAGRDAAALSNLLAGCALLGFVLQGVALAAHQRSLRSRGAEADVSRVQMLTTYGRSYAARWASLVVLVSGTFTLLLWTPPGAWLPVAWALVFALALLHEIVGRALFYVLVTPTTMPGAFFWNNKYFEQHARQTGLAAMPQVGVVPNVH